MEYQGCYDQNGGFVLKPNLESRKEDLMALESCFLLIDHIAQSKLIIPHGGFFIPRTN